MFLVGLGSIRQREVLAAGRSLEPHSLPHRDDSRDDDSDFSENFYVSRERSRVAVYVLRIVMRACNWSRNAHPSQVGHVRNDTHRVVSFRGSIAVAFGRCGDTSQLASRFLRFSVCSLTKVARAMTRVANHPMSGFTDSPWRAGRIRSRGARCRGIASRLAPTG